MLNLFISIDGKLIHGSLLERDIDHEDTGLPDYGTTATGNLENAVLTFNKKLMMNVWLQPTPRKENQTLTKTNVDVSDTDKPKVT